MAASFGNYGVLEGDCILTLKTHRQMLEQEHAFCFRPVPVSMCDNVLKVREHNILQTACRKCYHFQNLGVKLGTNMNYLHFEVKRLRS